LNKENKWVGGKVAALYEFKGEDKKIKDFMIASSVRGAKEPVEDKESKYGKPFVSSTSSKKKLTIFLKATNINIVWPLILMMT
jgi:hypothetical protein